MVKFNLDKRLIDFASLVIDICEGMPKTMGANHIAAQLLRSGTAPALIYGEAQSAESSNDFCHKMKLALKELRESYSSLRIIMERKWYDQNKLAAAIDENNQLISIFVKSIDTAKKNAALSKK